MNYYMFFGLLAYASGAYGMAFGIYKSLQNHRLNNKIHNPGKPVLEEVCSERTKRIEEMFKDMKENIKDIKADIKMIAGKNESS